MTSNSTTTQAELAAARRAKKAARAGLKLHGEGGDRASAAQLAAGDDNRIFCGYVIGGEPDAAATSHIVMVNFGVKAAGRSEDACRTSIARALATLPPPLPGEAGQPVFLRVCESKVCFTFKDASAATRALVLFNSAEGHGLLGRKVRCAFARSVLPAVPGVVARPRLAISWETYTRDAILGGGGGSCGSGGSGGSSNSSARASDDGLLTTTASVIPVPVVPGLTLVLGAVTTEEEQTLVQHIEEHGNREIVAAAGWSTCARRVARERPGFRMEDHRRVMHFGHAFDYDTRGVGRRETGGALPIFLQALTLKLKPLIPRSGVGGDTDFDQCTVNEYLPGLGIAAHVDTHSTFGPTLCSLSLLGQTVMSFVHSVTGARIDMILPPRSLLVLQDEARYVWTHGIASRTTDLVKVRGKDQEEEEEALVPRATRLSLTLRKLRDVAAEGPCACQWPRWCDSAQGTKIIPDVLGGAEVGVGVGAGSGGSETNLNRNNNNNNKRQKQ